MNNLPTSISEKLITGRKLREKGKYQEALELALYLEKDKDQTSEEKVECMIFKGRVYIDLGKSNNALEIAEQVYQVSQEMGNSLKTLDALNIKALTYWQLRNFVKAKDVIIEFEKIFNTITGVKSRELTKRKAWLMAGKAGIHVINGDWEDALQFQLKAVNLHEEIDDKIGMSFNLYYAAIECLLLGNLDQALKCGKKAVALKEIRNKETISSLNILGDIYRTKGELDLAVDYAEQALELAKELDNIPSIIESLYNLGQIFYIRGELEKASKLLKQSILLSDEHQIPSWLMPAFLQLVRTLVDDKSVEEAKKYLQRMQVLRDQHKIITYYHYYRIAKAYILKNSFLVNEVEEAERLLREVTGDKKDFGPTTNIALIYLCEILLSRTSKTDNPEILGEIKSIITRLLEIAEKQHSYRWLVYTLLLQAKLALIEKNIDDARTLFTQAQHMAEWHNLSILARIISGEHDNFLENLEKWEELHKTNTPISERIEFSGMSNLLENMSEKRRIKIPELEPEYPVLLTIMSKTGYIIFTNPFSVEIPFDESRIGEFVSFFNSISSQMYSESLDRAKFGDHTIILRTLDSISFCYLFEGESYIAQLRLNRFCEAIKEDTTIMRMLKTAMQTGQTLIIEDNPELESLIAKNFLSDPQKFQTTHEADEVQKLVKKSRRIRKRFTSRWKRISRTVKSEIMVEVMSLLLYLTSHLLWLAHIGDIKILGIIPGITEVRDYINLTLFLAVGCQLIVLAFLIMNWQNKSIKNKIINKAIIIQIVALILLLTAHFFYLSHQGFLDKLNWTDTKYTFFIDIALFPGFGCQILVIYLIIDDYMKHY
jgi:tetratricopeptide (TPR) repeat protein